MSGPMFVPEGITAPLSWPADGPTHVDTESWGRYLAQHYAKPSERENNNRAREMTAADLSLVQCSERNYVIVCPPEMTAADLGLYDADEARAWVHKQMLATNAVYRRMVLGDAPYSFWLGADR